MNPVRVLALLAFIVALSLPAFAAPDRRIDVAARPAERLRQTPPLGRTLRSLQLEPAQQRAVHRVIVQFDDEQRSSNPPTRQELLRRIQAVLTPAQRAKFRSLIGEPPTP
jgi:Spy/CpxP family protein refolding chaperone